MRYCNECNVWHPNEKIRCPRCGSATTREKTSNKEMPKPASLKSGMKMENKVAIGFGIFILVLLCIKISSIDVDPSSKKNREAKAKMPTWPPPTAQPLSTVTPGITPTRVYEIEEEEVVEEPDDMTDEEYLVKRNKLIGNIPIAVRKQIYGEWQAVFGPIEIEAEKKHHEFPEKYIKIGESFTLKSDGIVCPLPDCTYHQMAEDGKLTEDDMLRLAASIAHYRGGERVKIVGFKECGTESWSEPWYRVQGDLDGWIEYLNFKDQFSGSDLKEKNAFKEELFKKAKLTICNKYKINERQFDEIDIEGVESLTLAPTPVPTIRNKNTTIGALVQITQTGFFGFINESDLDKIDEYIIAKDNEALEKALMTLLLSDRATPFQRGEDVYIVDKNVWKDLVKLRRKGELAEYWAFKQVVE